MHAKLLPSKAPPHTHCPVFGCLSYVSQAKIIENAIEENIRVAEMEEHLHNISVNY